MAGSQSDKKGCLVLVGMLVFVTVLVALCSRGEGPSDREQRLSRLRSIAVCHDFRNVMFDAHDGKLTGADVTERLNELEEDAADATAEVQTAYAEVLAADSRGDLGISSEAGEDMLAACHAVESRHSEAFS